MASVTFPCIAFTFSWASKPSNLPLKCQTKIAADDTLCFNLYLLKKIRLDILCESSAGTEDSHEISSLIFSEEK